MAYKRISPDRYNERKIIVDRLKRTNEPYSYTSGVSLAAYEAAVEKVKLTAEEKNASLEIADAKGEAYLAACEEEDKLLMALRACIGADKGKSSDEYVFAGGARQSDVIAQQQQTREEKKKSTEDVTKPK